MEKHWNAMQNKNLWEPIVSYGLLGWFLGTMTPGFCALLILSDRFDPADENDRTTGALLVVVVLICSIVGLLAGAAAGRIVKTLRERVNALALVLLSPVLGLLWGIAAGGAGGLPIFIVGAVFGAAIAAAIGAVGFALFAGVYETLGRRFRFGFWQGPLLAFVVSLILSLAVGGAFYLNSK